MFRGALIFNAALTAFWLFLVFSQRQGLIFQRYNVDGEAIGRVLSGVFFFNVIWGFIWYGVKGALLRYWVGFSPEERRRAFQSRMDAPFEVSSYVARYSERRIRIADMIGRRGRFITLGAAGFYYLYTRIAAEPSSDFATLALTENLFDGVVSNWIFLSFFYANNVLAAAFYGPQSRVMDGMLARANCLLIATLWSAFKFVMVPLGGLLATRFAPDQFAVLFALIWGSYIVADTMAEAGGALFGRQRLRVRGIGDVNRKSIGGTVTGFLACLVFCVWIVQAHGLPTPWLALALPLSVSNTLLELYSPRGTDDFTMATTNALICVAFGYLVA